MFLFFFFFFFEKIIIQAYSFEPKPDFKAKADEAERMWKKDLSKVYFSLFCF